MIHADYRYTLPVSPATAFAYLANPANDPEWQGSCVECELLDGAPQPGARYRIVFSFLGRRTDFLAAITERAPGSRYAFKALKGPFRYEGSYDFRPHPDGVEVHWQFAAEPAGFFGILPPTLLRKVLVSQVERDVARLRKDFVAQWAISQGGTQTSVPTAP